jgi:hypothetical protein
VGFCKAMKTRELGGSQTRSVRSDEENIPASAGNGKPVKSVGSRRLKENL